MNKTPVKKGCPIRRNSGGAALSWSAHIRHLTGFWRQESVLGFEPAIHLGQIEERGGGVVEIKVPGGVV